MSITSTRTETDSFGPIDVPGDAYWGAQTQRSIANFPFGPRELMPAEIVHALGYVKQAAARVNARIGGLDAGIAEAVQQAAAEVAPARSTTSSRWSSGRPGSGHPVEHERERSDRRAGPTRS
jgi:fumarate hydratase class II